MLPDDVEVLARPVTDWRVTASHRVMRFTWKDGPLWTPFGTWHTRVIGEGFSLCGVVTNGWPTFWELPFGEEDHPMACRRCLEIVRR